VSDALNRLLDEAALRCTAEIYALGADRRERDLWRQVLADDCVIDGPGFRTEGMDANLASLDALGEMFRRTLHCVHQVFATIDADAAIGETYCTAKHLLRDADAVLVWSIRYRDTWRRNGGVWRFTHRKLIVEWQETRPVEVIGEES